MRKNPRIPPSTDTAALQADLLAWFASRARDLPWRRHRTLYGTWISEVMLQQTTVQTVVPYWERFLREFPDVRALAAADESAVLGLWSGLGYYRRARQLHAAARRVVAERGGRLPRDSAGWLQLPGIGAYTGGAIASLALGEAVPALDANARRVHLRWAAASLAERDALVPRRLDAFARALIPPRTPGNWNEAVMELGALVCRARNPLCANCPVRRHCRAAAAGLVDLVPAPAPREPAQPVRAGVLACAVGRRVLLLPPGAAPAAAADCPRPRARDDFRALHRGLWGLPMTPWFAVPPAEDEPLPASVWRPWPGAAVRAAPRLAGAFRHAITRYRLTVEVHVLSPAAFPDGIPGFQGQIGRLVDPAAPEVPISGFVRKALDLLARQGGS